MNRKNVILVILMSAMVLGAMGQNSETKELYPPFRFVLPTVPDSVRAFPEKVQIFRLEYALRFMEINQKTLAENPIVRPDLLWRNLYFGFEFLPKEIRRNDSLIPGTVEADSFLFALRNYQKEILNDFKFMQDSLMKNLEQRVFTAKKNGEIVDVEIFSGNNLSSDLVSASTDWPFLKKGGSWDLLKEIEKDSARLAKMEKSVMKNLNTLAKYASLESSRRRLPRRIYSLLTWKVPSQIGVYESFFDSYFYKLETLYLTDTIAWDSIMAKHQVLLEFVNYAEYNLFQLGNALRCKMSKRQKRLWKKQVNNYLILQGGAVIISGDHEPARGWFRKILYRYIHGTNQKRMVPNQAIPAQEKNTQEIFQV